ncbi:hypothetical protein SAAL107622_07770 [Lacicoccus alkaliphilus]
MKVHGKIVHRTGQFPDFSGNFSMDPAAVIFPAQPLRHRGDIAEGPGDVPCKYACRNRRNHQDDGEEDCEPAPEYDHGIFDAVEWIRSPDDAPDDTFFVVDRAGDIHHFDFFGFAEPDGFPGFLLVFDHFLHFRPVTVVFHRFRCALRVCQYFTVCIDDGEAHADRLPEQLNPLLQCFRPAFKIAGLNELGDQLGILKQMLTRHLFERILTDACYEEP